MIEKNLKIVFIFPLVESEEFSARYLERIMPLIPFTAAWKKNSTNEKGSQIQGTAFVINLSTEMPKRAQL